jgi:hypothetical protein
LTTVIVASINFFLPFNLRFRLVFSPEVRARTYQPHSRRKGCATRIKQRDNIVIKPADKDSAVVVMDKVLWDLPFEFNLGGGGRFFYFVYLCVRKHNCWYSFLYSNQKYLFHSNSEWIKWLWPKETIDICKLICHALRNDKFYETCVDLCIATRRGHLKIQNNHNIINTMC